MFLIELQLLYTGQIMIKFQLKDVMQVHKNIKL